MSGVSVDMVGRALDALLTRENRPLIYRDWATGDEVVLSPASASSPSGYLPALVVAGETVWREATGKGFGLDIVGDRATLLGYRLRAIREGTFSTVMLSTMEATAQVAGPRAIILNDLNALWATAVDRIEQRASVAATTSKGAMP